MSTTRGVVPVALFAYRRADLLRRVLAALRANHVPLLYVYSDGPRDAAVAAEVEEVRRELRGIDWVEVHIVEWPANLGVDESVPKGISDVLTRHESVIVCEDDIELAPGAYGFLCAALDRYRDEQRVMCVGAWAHPRVTPRDVTAPYFTARADTWGWGTWRRAWAGLMDHAPREMYDMCVARGMDVGRYGRDIVDGALRAEGANWDYRFNLYMFLHQGLSLMPPVSMAAHLGRDLRATHPNFSEGWADHPLPAPPLDAVHWPDVREHPESAALWKLATDPPPPSIVARIRRRLRRLLGTGRRAPGGA